MSYEGDVVNLNEVCRVCLSKTDSMRPLLGLSGQITLVSKLSALTNSVIVLMDKYPTCICNMCEEKLNNSYEFQKLCHRTNQLLNECLETNKELIVTLDNEVIDLNKTVSLEGISAEEENVISADAPQDQGDLNGPVILEHVVTNCCKESETNGAEKSQDCQDPRSSESLEALVLNFKPKRVKDNQKLKLDQYAAEDVAKIISMVKQKFCKHVSCISCSFEAATHRSLSIHMTRVHKEVKRTWCSSCNKVVNNLKQHFRKKHAGDLKCPLCKSVTRSHMSHFIEHLASHSAEKLHKCTVCDDSFVSNRRLKTHQLSVHSKTVLFSCKVCDKKFGLRQSLRRHTKSHPKCDKCEFTFDNIDLYEKHECTQSTDQDIKHFDGDDKNEKEDVEIENDTSEDHLQNYCKLCEKRVRSLEVHSQKYHKVNTDSKKLYKNLCPHCGKQFKSVSKLMVHIRIHTGETPYKCKYCDRKVKTRSILVSHERTHTGEKPYVCKICGKRFAQSSVLNTHLKIHTGRPEECTLCSKRFCRRTELVVHMRQHTGEKPFSCTSCGMAFKQRSHLVEHTKTHSGDRPFMCEYCEKGFKTHGTLKAHLQIHLGQKPYKCTHCAYACRQPHGLTTHMLQQHGVEKDQTAEFTCKICLRRYNTVAHFLAHYNRYHGSLEIKDFSSALVSPNNEHVEKYNCDEMLEENKDIIIEEIELDPKVES